MLLFYRLFVIDLRETVFYGFQVLVTVLFFVHLVSCLGMVNEFAAVSMHDIIGDDVFFEITEPEELAFTYKIRPAQDFGTTFNRSFYVRNVPLVVVDPATACGEIFNANEIVGNVALVQRGECSFLTKSIRMEKEGAIAIIVTDDDKNNDAMYIEMVDDNTQREVNIPAGFLLGKSGYVITSILNRLELKYALINLPVNVSKLAINQLNQPPWLSW